MPNRKKHQQTAFWLEVVRMTVVNYSQQQNRINNGQASELNLGELVGKSLLHGGISAAFCMVPDQLEPATNPRHRKTFHSVTAGSAMTFGMIKANNSDLDDDWKQVINSIGVGIGSHLILDSETDAGLPWV